MPTMSVRRAPTAAIVLVAAIFAVLALGAIGASAAEEVGSTCVANESRPNSTAIVLYTNGMLAPQPNVIPPGVITRWRVHAPADQAPIPQRLVVNRQVGEQDDAKVGESALETVGPGTSEFATRVPAPEYAHVGLTGPDGALFCDHVDMDTAGLVEDQWAIGETRHFGVAVNASVPVVAVVEPDRDNDGYGDETQDGCPQSALYQGGCPLVELKAVALAKRRSIVIHVVPSAEAKIYAWGQVGWKAETRSGKTHRRTVGLGPADYRWVGTGVKERIKLPLPKAVIRRLSRIPPWEFLRAKVFVHSMDLAGRPSTRRLNVRLRGRGRG
jgi:hypothetical protein